MPTKYKVEKCDATGQWVTAHPGFLATYGAALEVRSQCAYGRIMVDHLGDGVWEEMPPVDPLTPVTCPECEGTGDGPFDTTCGDCDGVGTVPLAQADEYPR